MSSGSEVTYRYIPTDIIKIKIKLGMLYTFKPSTEEPERVNVW